jgi:transposase InsO family protein
MARIVCLHGVPKRIVSDRGTQFTSEFWERLHDTMDTCLDFSSAYYPHTNGQRERENESDFLGYVESLCSAIWEKLG